VKAVFAMNVFCVAATIVSILFKYLSAEEIHVLEFTLFKNLIHLLLVLPILVHFRTNPKR